MQLKRLDAYGFKSFADKISIDFDSGITAIVGPNGSGKSNITDAIRWVLGEQSMKNLRGMKAEDIIFTGSAMRKALGIAEVSLVFENDGTLPLDFQEVCITRRLYRSGESAYYINRGKCRLKDIYDLFADTGIGHEGMSIIGQNRIDDILNSRPEERRTFFEETAGITKYKARKRETVRKITETENNLVRVKDIMHEIETQLEPLARHAEKTRAYNALMDSYKGTKLTVLVRSYEAARERKAESDALQRAAGDRALEAETKVRTLEAAKAANDRQIVGLDQKMREQAEKNEEVRAKLEQVNQDRARLMERRAQGDAERARIKARHEELTAVAQQTVTAIVCLTDEMARRKKDFEDLSTAMGENRKKADTLAARVEKQKEAVKEAQQEAADKQSLLMEKRQALAVLERDIKAGEDGRNDRAEARKTQEEKLRHLCELDEKLAHDLAVETAAEETARQEQTAAVAAQEIAERAAREAIDRVRQLESKRSQAEGNLKFLTRMQEGYEGFGRAAKAILKAQASWRAGISGAVAELIHVERVYVTAVEVALGGNIQNIVTKDTETAKAAIGFLKRGRFGRVTFLPLSTLVVRQPARLNCDKTDGVIGWANELAHADGAYQKAINFLLGRTLVVDTLDHALALAEKLGHRQRIVTLEGELLHPGGSLSGGSRQNKEASFLNRSSEIDTLRAEIASLKKDAAAAHEKSHAVARETTEAGIKERELRKTLAAHELRLLEIRTNQGGLKENMREQKRLVAEQKLAAEKFETTFAASQQRQDLLLHESKALEEEYEAVKSRAEKAVVLLENLLQDESDLKEYINGREVRRAILEQQTASAKKQIELRQEEKARNEEALRKTEQEEKALVDFMAASTDALCRMQEKAETMDLCLNKGKEAYDAIYKARMGCVEERDRIEGETKKASQALNKLREEIHKIDVQGAKLEIERKEQEETLLSSYGLTPERAAELAEDTDDETIHARLKSLKEEIDALGPVNPNAVREYEELKNRHAFMERQANDLVEAKGNLATILSDMDAAMTKQFKEAFAEIQVYFSDIFVRLFGGGKAEIKLLDEADVLNTGVEILVTLPRKKQQSLAALSGGERALTVIALLFSFLRYRPSPFSVLDEIDAPLDEANVKRFGGFLKEFADHTQFIVVTHRKGTMEVSDVMYGVTIEDAGISRILSVKLEDAVTA